MESEIRRLNEELALSLKETSRVSEDLGETRGKLMAANEKAVATEANHAALASEKERRQRDLRTALDEARELLRQYVPQDRSLVQELINERRQVDARE